MILLPGALKVDMTLRVKLRVNNLPKTLVETRKAPWNKNLFKVYDTSKKLNLEMSKIFYTYAMKGMLLCKRGRQDIVQPGIAFLVTRVINSNKHDWAKLLKTMNF